MNAVLAKMDSHPDTQDFPGQPVQQVAEKTATIKRAYRLQYSASTPEAQTNRCIDSWNAILGRLPCGSEEIYFSKEPEIQMLKEGNFLSYWLYASEKAWFLFEKLASNISDNEESSNGAFSESIAIV